MMISAQLYSTEWSGYAIPRNICRALVFNTLIIRRLPALAGESVIWYTYGIEYRDEFVLPQINGLLNDSFIFPFCKSTCFKRSAVANRFIFRGGVHHGNHMPDAEFLFTNKMRKEIQVAAINTKAKRNRCACRGEFQHDGIP